VKGDHSGSTSRWTEWFARERQRIRDALGERVLLLEHVGSTSVPGLIAKPRIDIVLADGSPEITRMLRFRDRLRRHPDERERYAAAKRELAARRWNHMQDYADAKTDVVEAILERAEHEERAGDPASSSVSRRSVAGAPGEAARTSSPFQASQRLLV
jgi:GrpB-like predicted nucleotidyltransferase (UPF0157 family)